MEERQKYLYWLSDKTDIKEVALREMYSRIGYIFHCIQMVEYNIANILSLELLEKEKKEVFTERDIQLLKERIKNKCDGLLKNTFGYLKNIAKESQYLKDLDFDELDSVVEYRDNLAHQCFKQALLKNKLTTLEDIDCFISELNDYEEQISELNEKLVSIFNEQRIKTVLIKKAAKNG